MDLRYLAVRQEERVFFWASVGCILPILCASCGLSRRKRTKDSLIGDQCEGQLFLSFLLILTEELMLALSIFQAFVESADNATGQKRAYKVYRMTKRDSYLQDIGYNLLYYNDRFNSVYNIRDVMSLVLFEMAHIYDKHIPVICCKNCGHYFVPQKRFDSKYCNYPAPDNPEKTCKEIGAQNTWSSKEKSDDVTQAYRKVYMRTIKTRVSGLLVFFELANRTAAVLLLSGDIDHDGCRWKAGSLMADGVCLQLFSENR